MDGLWVRRKWPLASSASGASIAAAKDASATRVFPIEKPSSAGGRAGGGARGWRRSLARHRWRPSEVRRPLESCRANRWSPPRCSPRSRPAGRHPFPAWGWQCRSPRARGWGESRPSLNREGGSAGGHLVEVRVLAILARAGEAVQVREAEAGEVDLPPALRQLGDERNRPEHVVAAAAPGQEHTLGILETRPERLAEHPTTVARARKPMPPWAGTAETATMHRNWRARPAPSSCSGRDRFGAAAFLLDLAAEEVCPGSPERVVAREHQGPEAVAIRGRARHLRLGAARARGASAGSGAECRPPTAPHWSDARKPSGVRRGGWATDVEIARSRRSRDSVKWRAADLERFVRRPKWRSADHERFALRMKWRPAQSNGDGRGAMGRVPGRVDHVRRLALAPGRAGRRRGRRSGEAREVRSQTSLTADQEAHGRSRTATASDISGPARPARDAEPALRSSPPSPSWRPCSPSAKQRSLPLILRSPTAPSTSASAAPLRCPPTPSSLPLIASPPPSPRTAKPSAERSADSSRTNIDSATYPSELSRKPSSARKRPPQSTGAAAFAFRLHFVATITGRFAAPCTGRNTASSG
jgi:hypothetical protein